MYSSRAPPSASGLWPDPESSVSDVPDLPSHPPKSSPHLDHLAEVHCREAVVPAQAHSWCSSSVGECRRVTISTAFFCFTTRAKPVNLGTPSTRTTNGWSQ